MRYSLWFVFSISIFTNTYSQKIDKGYTVDLPAQSVDSTRRFESKKGRIDINDERKVGIITPTEELVSYEYDDFSYISTHSYGLLKEGLWRVYTIATNKFLPDTTYSDIQPFGDFLIAFQNKEGLWGVIDTIGNIKAEVQYSSIGILDNICKVSIVEKDKYWGALNRAGEVAVAPIYQKLVFSSFVPLIAAKLNDEWGVIDTTGTIILAPQYKKIGAITELIAVKKNEKWGYVNHTNIVKIPFVYDEVNSFLDGLAPVKKGTQWGYVDSTNKVILPFIYDYAGYFSNEQAEVNKNGKWIKIDKFGKCLSGCN